MFFSSRVWPQAPCTDGRGHIKMASQTCGRSLGRSFVVSSARTVASSLSPICSLIHLLAHSESCLEDIMIIMTLINVDTNCNKLLYTRGQKRQGNKKNVLFFSFHQFIFPRQKNHILSLLLFFLTFIVLLHLLSFLLLLAFSFLPFIIDFCFLFLHN